MNPAPEISSFLQLNSEDRRVQFASLKLTGTAQLFWESVEELLERCHAPSVGSWDEMKRRLQEKYLPQSYKGHLLDQWNALTQGTGPVTETPFRSRGDNRTPVSSAPSSTAPTVPQKSILGPSPSKGPLVGKNKGRGPEIQRTSFRLQCFNCKGFDHISSNCLSRALVLEEHESREDGVLEDQVYKPKFEEFEDLDDNEDTFLGCIRTLPVELESRLLILNTSRLGVVRCILTQPKNADDWRRYAIFHTYSKINNKGCKVIVDSGSCINAVSMTTVAGLGLQFVPHPQPYSVYWVDTSSITVNERCLVPIQFLEYKDHIWCDVIPMDVGHIILGRPWLFDLDVTIYGRSNSCSFIFNGKKIHINPFPPRHVGLHETKKSAERKELHIINPTEFERTLVGNSVVFAFVVLEVSSSSPSVAPPEAQTIIQEFQDVFPEDLPDELPLLRDMQHAIDLVPRASLPNLPIIG
ncbi:unnamed protein product [Fraxinus pennsylvanica]|uniref:Retrotransposon gag domain-containing protein n=1 Tax=Fraxinus pennsylvanica TaxID=56036 RepID=A0AAD1YXM3_9LAMI|nr:unnamed protein product [Fraxinus pennsylvanica]